MKEKGFTLIELLVVIAIIGMLSSVVLASLNSARGKSRDALRREDLVQLRTALENYYSTNGSYPVTAGNWFGMCSYFNTGCNGGGAGSCTTSGATGWIPNLAPTYISVLPRDPVETSTGCLLYRSVNGADYKILVYQTVESTVAATDGMYDPAIRPNTYAVYTPGAATSY